MDRSHRYRSSTPGPDRHRVQEKDEIRRRRASTPGPDWDRLRSRNENFRRSSTPGPYMDRQHSFDQIFRRRASTPGPDNRGPPPSKVPDVHLTEAELFQERVMQSQLKRMTEFDKSPIALISKGEFVPSIFVSNLANLKEADIIKGFEQIGPVRGFDWGVPLYSAFGFVYFEKKETVAKILRSHLVVQGINIKGTKVKIQDGEPKLDIHKAKIYQFKHQEAKRQNFIQPKPQPEPQPRESHIKTQFLTQSDLFKKYNISSNTQINSLDPRLRPREVKMATPSGIGGNNNNNNQIANSGQGQVQVIQVSSTSASSSTLNVTAPKLTTNEGKSKNKNTQVKKTTCQATNSKPESDYEIKDGYLKIGNSRYGPDGTKYNAPTPTPTTSSANSNPLPAKKLKPDDTKAKSVTNVSIYSSSTATGSLASTPSPTKLKFKKKSESKTKDSTEPLQNSPSFPYPQHPDQLNLPIGDNDLVVSGESKIRRSLFFYGIGNGNRSNQITIFKEYFSKFGSINEINISADKYDKSNGYGYCVFEKSSTVDKIQGSRPHRLEGCLFYTKRTIHLDKNFLKEPTNTTKMSYNTIFIYGMSEVTATEELYNFFSKYGNVLDIYLSPNVDLVYGGHSFVTFEDFDSVDKVTLLPQPTIDGKIVIIYKVWSKLEVEYAKKNYKQYISIIHETMASRVRMNGITIPTLISTKMMSPANRPAATLTTEDYSPNYTQSSSLYGPIRNNLSSSRINPYPVQGTSSQREVLPQPPALPNILVPPMCQPGSQEWITYWDRYDGTYKLFNLRMERYINYMRDYI